MKTKHFLLCAVCVIFFSLTSCFPTQKFSRTLSFVDFSSYTKDGFFLTELESVPFDYTTIGTMSVSETSGVDKEYVQDAKEATGFKKYEDGIYGSPSKKTDKHWRSANFYSCLDALVEEAKFAGGDGIVKLQMGFGFDKEGRWDGSLNVSGMVIKRK